MGWALKLPSQLRYEAWRTYVTSKLLYSKYLAATYSKRIAQETKSLTYRLTKQLLGIKGKPNLQNFIQTAYGMSYDKLEKAQIKLINDQASQRKTITTEPESIEAANTLH